ncbi:MAG: hypothetical protein L0H93_05615 [Nocardioides sp.]|nr:hypothetical protein [Nocardioides sp.]
MPRHQRSGHAPVSALAVLLPAILLAGCVGGGDAPSDAQSDAEERQPAGIEAGETPDGTTPDANASASPDRDPLADLVEKQASKVPTPEGVQLRDPTYGADISWPQCAKGVGPIPERVGLGMPMPKAEWRFVIVGLTNGPAMTQNPCLDEQLSWARQNDVLVSTYAVATYPSDDQLDEHGDDGPYDADSTEGRLANWGYAQAEFNLATMEEVGLEVPSIWMDVETVPSPPLVAWSDDKTANAAVVKGVERSYREADYLVGAYSTPHLWDTVVGDLSFGVPEWRAAGQTSEAEAVSRCAEESIQGGKALLGQWVADSRDRNVSCPGRARDLADWFTRL